jgi:hypothetical protein
MQNPRPRRIPHVWIEHDLLDRYGQALGPRGIAVYVAIARFANEPDAPPMLEAVGQITGLGPAAMMGALERIERFGLIERETEYDDQTGEMVSSWVLVSVTTESDP